MNCSENKNDSSNENDLLLKFITHKVVNKEEKNISNFFIN